MVRPSSMDRCAECAASDRMEAGIPDESTEDSRAGDEGHLFKKHPEFDRSVLKPQMRELLRIADELDDKLFGIVIQNERIRDDEEFVEMREVEAHYGDMPGHIDLLRRYPRRAVTIMSDYKFGYLIVDRAEMNLQLRSYATMSDDDTVYVAIAQPRAPLHERLTVAKYTREFLDKSRAEIDSIILRTLDPNAPLKAGLHCRFCKARAICPALQEALQKSIVPIGIVAPELSRAKKLGIVEARLAGATDEQMDKMLQADAMIHFIHDALIEEARRRISADGLQNYKLTRPIEKRKIIDSQRAIALLNLAGMSREDIMECVNLSITKLEEKLNSGKLRSGQFIAGVKDAKDFTTRVLSSVLELEVGKPRVLKK